MGKGTASETIFHLKNVDGQQTRLTGSCSHHLRDVLRMQKGSSRLDGLGTSLKFKVQRG